MLTCQGCMRHCLQAIIGSSVSIPARSRLISTASISTRPQNFLDSTREKKELAPWQVKMNKRVNRYGGHQESRTKYEGPGFNSPKKRRSTVKTREQADKEASLHLKFLRDPIKLAQFIRETLRADNYELAQAVVNGASSSMACVVSWNHIIEWQLSKGKMNGALKCYNEMKKRAQVPDAQTFTIIFNGCSQHKDSSQALEKVLTMYNSMLTEKAPVRPNTIHLNAVLKMCARAYNMEAMFSIVDQMSWNSITAPNNLTYTTIFNALRMHITTGTRDKMTPMQRRAYQQKNILHARYVWTDIVKAWRQGKIWIDEELACSMGRLLLIGDEQDQDDVLSLVEQTMNIPRQVPRIGTIEHHRSDPGSQGKGFAQVQAPMSKDDPRKGVPAEDATVADDAPATLAQDVPPEPITPIVFSPTVASTVTGVYAIPRQNTLSLIIQALTALNLKDAASKYWDLLFNKYNVAPDAENYHCYLRLLRLTRSSTEIVNLMMKMPKSYMEAKTFKIAMSGCVRDIKNQHAFANAGKLLDIMQSALREPEIEALHDYLEVAIMSDSSSKRATSRQETSKYEQGKQIRRGLDRLQPSFVNLKSSLLFRDPNLSELKDSELRAYVQNILALTKRMISAYDILVQKAMVPREECGPLIHERSKLAAFVTRHKYGSRIPQPPTVQEEQTEDEKVPLNITRR